MDNKDKGKTNYKEQLKAALKDLKTPGKRHKQIPNLLTASRLLSPLLIIPAALTGNVSLAVWSAIGFGITDLLDGKLSGLLDAKSDLGADLDAFTDKIFAGTLLIAGAFFNPILTTNILLELGIAGINLKQKFSGKEASSTMVGKVKTGLLFTLGGLGLVAPALTVSPLTVTALSITTAIMQGATIASYVKKYKDDSSKPKTNISNTTKIEIPKTNNEQVIENTKVKTKTESTPTTLEELRELREFFKPEEQNINVENKETSKVYQKTKKEE